MPHFANPADELRQLEEKQFTVGLSDEEQARLAALSPAASGAGVGGFDVTAAAAGVRAEVELVGEADPGGSPAAPAAWTAADYGWDPADSNAVAWAAYYSELGWDPATAHAHLAAEAEAAEVAAPGETGTFETPADVEPAEVMEVEPDELLAEVALAGSDAGGAPGSHGPEILPAADVPGASWEAPAAVASCTAEGDDVPAPDALSGRTLMWDLGGDRATRAAPAPTQAAEIESAPDFQHAIPPGWPGESVLALEGDFALAGAGSFQPAPSAAFTGLDAEPLDAAAPPPPQNDLPDDEFTIDIEGDDLAAVAERAPAGVPSEPALPQGPAPELDWAATHALPAGDHVVDFAAFDASPNVDAPGDEEETPEGTALWSPPLPEAPPAPDRDLEEPLPPPLELEPLDAPPATETWQPAGLPPLELAPPEPAGAPLDVPFDLGSAAEAAPPLAPGPAPFELARPGEAVDAPLPASAAEFLALAQTLATAAPGSTAEAEVAEVSDADILEVGDDVVEVAEASTGDGPDLAAGSPTAELEAELELHAELEAELEPHAEAQPEPEPGPHAEAQPEPEPHAEPEPFAPFAGAAHLAFDAPPHRPAPDQLDPAALHEEQAGSAGERDAPAAELQPAPEPTAPELPPAPEPPPAELRASKEPPEPSLSASEPEPLPAPAAEPTAYVSGTHRVVVHTADGQVKRGTVTDLMLDTGEILLAPQAGGVPEKLAADRIRAIFFMLPSGESPPSPAGKKVRVTFRDGRQVAGFSPDYDPERVGFFMIPADSRTHTARIWVYRSSVRQVSVT